MTTPEPLPPETISALIRDPESGFYPCQIGVFCDGCGTTVEHDYLVHEDMDKAARFEVARVTLRREYGWTCDAVGDFCPACVKANEDATADAHAQQARTDEAQAIADGWNKLHEAGTSVRYWPGLRLGAGVASKTRTEASVLGGHTAVVWVEGHTSCIALTHVQLDGEQVPAGGS